MAHFSFNFVHYSMKFIVAIVLSLFFLSLALAHDVNSIYPYPKAAWNKPGQFTITSQTKIYVTDLSNNPDWAALEMLQSAIQKAIGVTLQYGTGAGSNGIVFGEPDRYSLLKDDLTRVMPAGEPM